MKIYLACPYSHKSEAVRKLRYETVTRIAAMLMQNGHYVFSPITHSHPIADLFDDRFMDSYECWQWLDEYMIDGCDEVWVLMLPGWQGSYGIGREIDYARRAVKPVRGITTTGEAVELCSQ